jgi:hypothetical protein
MSAGMALAQESVPSNLAQYLGLSDTQAAAINALNSAFSTYTNAQQTAFYQVLDQAYSDLGQNPPGPNTVGQDYAQLEMIRRAYYAQLAQVQSQVAALLTPSQVTLVNGLVQVERLQSLVAEAQCASFAPGQGTERNGDFFIFLIGIPTVSTCPQIPPLPVALGNYLNLTDGQISTIEGAIVGNQDYVSLQSAKIKELQDEIQGLTAAATIDTATLGADYVAIAQIDQDKATQATQLTTAVRSVLTSTQTPLMQALDNARSQAYLASEAACSDILVPPPDVPNFWLEASNYAAITVAGDIPASTFPSGPCGGIVLPTAVRTYAQTVRSSALHR